MAEKIKPNMQKAVNAEIERQKKELGDEAPKSRGTYEEAPGGGTPAKGGGRGAMKKNFEVVDSKEEAEAIRKSDPDAVIRYNQPRDENGQFTYNSANNKEITTKYSRGHTLPPFLKGVDLTFIKKGSEFKYEDIDENGKKMIVTVISSIDMTAEELKSTCKKYLETEGGFATIVGTAIVKGGRKSKANKSINVGKVGDLDVSALAQSTQDKLNQVSKNKDGQWIAGQTLVSDIIKQGDLNVTNPAYAYKLAQEGPLATPPVPKLKKTVTSPVQPIKQTKPTTPSTTNVTPKTPVGAGASTGSNTQKEPTKKIFTETSKTFDDNYKKEVKNDPKKWVNENKDKIKKAMEKNPKLTPGAIANAIYSGKVSKWDDLL